MDTRDNETGSMFKIADQIFGIEATEFSANLSIGQDGWGMSWRLEFSAQEKVVADELWKPSIGSHYFSTELPDLYSLASSETCLDDAGVDDEPLFLFYMFEHTPVRSVVLQFGEWNGTRIPVRFSGVVDLNFSDEYGEDVPVDISMDLPFDGVNVDEATPEKAMEKFSRFFDPSRFHAPDRIEGSGAHLFRPRVI